MLFAFFIAHLTPINEVQLEAPRATHVDMVDRDEIIIPPPHNKYATIGALTLYLSFHCSLGQRNVSSDVSSTSNRSRRCFRCVYLGSDAPLCCSSNSYLPRIGEEAERQAALPLLVMLSRQLRAVDNTKEDHERHEPRIYWQHDITPSKGRPAYLYHEVGSSSYT